MKSDNMTNGNSEEFKNPYVLLKRFSTEEINSYLQNRETIDDGYLTDSEIDDEFQTYNSHHYFDDLTEKVYRSYVLLERLSPHDIQNLSNKKD